MTNKEIRKDIERRIILLNGVENAFNDIVEGNLKAIFTQIPLIKKTKNDNDIFQTANMAISFTISGFKRAGIINKLYNVVLFERNENVVLDEIMNFAITKTTELWK